MTATAIGAAHRAIEFFRCDDAKAGGLSYGQRKLLKAATFVPIEAYLGR